MNLENSVIQDRYRLIEVLGEGGISTVYRAEDLTGVHPHCSVKVLKNGSISHRVEDIIRFNAEASIVSRLDHPRILSIYDVGNQGGLHFIAMEYLRGESLEEALCRGGPLEVDRAVAVVEKVLEALAYIHERDIIHRDLKPGNIMLPGGGARSGIEALKVIDFALAQVKDFNRIAESAAGSGDVIAGTFSYMSPEQSGILKGHVDERSDLYSLGIMFYRLLMGELPYRGDNLSALLHQHIAAKPVGIRTRMPEVPPVVEKMVMKLIEKEPGRRYQSARGIMTDIARYREGYLDFEPGEYDKVVRPSFRTSLVGRDGEIDTLKRLFDRVRTGSGTLCLISGEAGSGKTRLAQELRDYVYAQNGLFIESKCYRAMNSFPFGPFHDALDAYLAHFQRKPEFQRNDAAGAMRRELGGLGGVILRLNDEMGALLGPCPPLVAIDPERDTQRLLLVAGSFFRLLAEIEQSLVIQIDDLQWADEGSLLLLEELARVIGHSHLMILGTYREEEVGEGHRITRLEAAAPGGGIPLHRIRVHPFDAAVVHDFVSHLLFQRDDTTRVLADHVYRRGKGNPLFTVELLKQMVAERVVTFSQGKWNFTLPGAGDVEIPEGIIDIIMARARRLDAAEREVIAFCAVIGKKIDTDLLLKVFAHRFDNVRTVRILDRALDMQILEEDVNARGVVSFSHDRVWEAFYRDIDGDERVEIHRHIARSMESLFSPVEGDPVYEVAYHYIECGDREGIIRYALPAAEMARDRNANDESLKYLAVATRAMEEKMGERPEPGLREAWIRAREMTGELYLTMGETEQAIKTYRALVAYRESPYDRALIYRQISLAYFKKGDWESCERNGREALRLLGSGTRVSRAGVAAGIAWQLAVHGLHVLAPRLFMKRRGVPRASDHLIVSVQNNMNWMYILSDVFKFVLNILKNLNICESRLGKSRELGMALGGYASMCMALPLFPRALRYHARSLELRRELKDDWGLGQSLQWLGYCHSWMGDPERSNEYFLQSLEIFTRIGDMWEIGMVLGGLSYNDYYCGNYDGAIIRIREYEKICRKLNDYYGMSRCHQYTAACLIEQADFENAEIYIRRSLEITGPNRILFNNCFDHTLLGYLSLERGDCDAAIEHLERAIAIDESNNFIRDYVVQMYPYVATAYIMKYLQGERGAGAALLRIRAACRRAVSMTRKWPNHHGSALRVMAMYHSLAKNERAAERCFAESVILCSRNGRKYELARTLFEYGKHLWRSGMEKAGLMKQESARRILRGINAAPAWWQAGPLPWIEAATGGDSPANPPVDATRLASVITVSRNISSILNLDQLLDGIMGNAVEVTGARRGYLFIKNPDSGALELRVLRDGLQSDRPEYSDAVVREVFASGRHLITTDAEKDRACIGAESVIRYGLKSILCTPIRVHDEVIGVCYLDNPLSRNVFNAEDAGILEVFMAQAGIAIENAGLYRNLERKVEERTRELNRVNLELTRAYQSVSQAYSVMKEDLLLARRIQESIMPRVDARYRHIDAAVRYFPMSEVGGDVYHLEEIREGYYRLFIADATGHGVQAALVTMIIMGEYDKLKNASPDPADLVSALNGIIIRDYAPLRMIFSCIVMDIDCRGGTLLHCSAGHPDQLLVRGGEVTSLRSNGRIVGFMPGPPYANVRTEILPGDRMMVYTDGLYEEYDRDERPFGEDRLKRLAAARGERSIEAVVDGIIRDLTLFMGHDVTTEISDDITLIGIEIRGTGESLN